MPDCSHYVLSNIFIFANLTGKNMYFGIDLVCISLVSEVTHTFVTYNLYVLFYRILQFLLIFILYYLFFNDLWVLYI